MAAQAGDDLLARSAWPKAKLQSAKIHFGKKDKRNRGPNAI
jgi:hypothetical protein